LTAATFPPPDASRAEVEAWQRAHGQRIPRDRVLCAVCGKPTWPRPLPREYRVRLSAKYKGKTFPAGSTPCSGHQVEAVE
jgi:hypothetical protein